jgi:hypothetical protein
MTHQSAALIPKHAHARITTRRHMAAVGIMKLITYSFFLQAAPKNFNIS